jgi:hypothetical protein
MNASPNRIAVIVSLLAVAIVVFFAWSYVSNNGPSDSFVKSLVEKQMQKRFAGCVITSMTLSRGPSFPLQAHYSKVGYGTPIYPIVVRAAYTVPLADGTRSDSREFNREFNFYKNASHQWVTDNELQ